MSMNLSGAIVLTFLVSFLSPEENFSVLAEVSLAHLVWKVSSQHLCSIVDIPDYDFQRY